MPQEPIEKPEINADCIPVQCACGATSQFPPASVAAWDRIGGWKCAPCMGVGKRDAALAHGWKFHTPLMPGKRSIREGK